MKVRALKSFEGIRDNERTAKEGKDIYPKEGETWEVTKERAELLLSHGVVEIVEDKKKDKKEKPIVEIAEGEITYDVEPDAELKAEIKLKEKPKKKKK